jgi:hypothetical protein
MMGNTLLIRNDDGDYSPAHRSLLEFFVAVKATAQLGLLPSDFTDPARSQSNVDLHGRTKDYTWSDYFRRVVDEKGAIRPIPLLEEFRPENRYATLAALGRMGEAVWRFVHEITNVAEVRSQFHELLATSIEQFNDGSRDPEREQDIIRFLLAFRARSQEWEAQTGQGDFIRRFWQDRLEQEVRVASGKIEAETLRINLGRSDSINIDMVLIPADSFLMGDEDNGPIHRVEITKPFMIATIPVT